MSASKVYVTALSVGDIFADPTYQRDLDDKRAQKMSDEWDPRLVGIVEVSDRGAGRVPRYAVIDGMHRWAAAERLPRPPSLVANVHTGLTVPEEAALFDRLNRQRKQISTWDHWKARRAAGDEKVLTIEQICRSHHVVIDMAAQDGCCGCVATLEQIVRMGGTNLLDETLELVTDIWSLRRDSLDATPREIKAEATTLKETPRGTIAILHAIAMINRYDRRPGPKLRVKPKDFGGGARNARSPKPEPRPKFDEQYRELRDLGYADWEIARRMGIKLDSLERQLYRYGLSVSDELAELAHEERARKRAS